MEEHSAPKEELVKLKLGHLIKFSGNFVGIEIHLLVGGKYVKMNYANEQFVDILKKLQLKEMEEVWVKHSDCKRILDEIQNNLTSKKLEDPKISDEQKIETLDCSQDTARTIMSHIGVSKETMEIMKTVNQKALSMLADSPSIYAFIKKFKQNCSEQFMSAMVTGFLTSEVIDQFPWKSVHVKEKAGLASILCDVTLGKEEFKELKAHYAHGQEVSAKVRNHPKEVVELLGKKKELIPSEVITIIEQHHELPDGKGFPMGIELNRFNQLSTIFIVCQRFTEMLFTEKFDWEKRGEVLAHLKQIYTGKNFEKALTALGTVVG